MLHEAVGNIENVARDVVNRIHTAIPGMIEAVDMATGLATITPVAAYTAPNGSKLEFPILSGVPLALPCSAAVGAEIAFPVRKGDSCMVIFAEQGLEKWLYGGETDGDLKFDLTNAMAIPGLCRLPGTAFKEACATGAVIIGNGETKVSVHKGGIVINGGVTINGNLSVNGGITFTSSISGPGLP